MSLVSINNFAAPFKSNTHVITLILVAALFGAYRYSGGSISTSSRAHEAPQPPTIDYTDEVVVPETMANDGQSKKDILDEMRAKSGSANGANGKNSLDEIEKQLGLR